MTADYQALDTGAAADDSNVAAMIRSHRRDTWSRLARGITGPGTYNGRSHRRAGANAVTHTERWGRNSRRSRQGMRSYRQTANKIPISKRGEKQESRIMGGRRLAESDHSINQLKPQNGRAPLARNDKVSQASNAFNDVDYPSKFPAGGVQPSEHRQHIAHAGWRSENTIPIGNSPQTQVYGEAMCDTSTRPANSVTPERLSDPSFGVEPKPTELAGKRAADRFTRIQEANGIEFWMGKAVRSAALTAATIQHFIDETRRKASASEAYLEQHINVVNSLAARFMRFNNEMRLAIEKAADYPDLQKQMAVYWLEHIIVQQLLIFREIRVAVLGQQPTLAVPSSLVAF
ncbi:hypothetical protein BESB_048340 [Besnoitia besnoiti]|uniref:Uncharacterized protein n=1 Tax=Besnoitia besnoiti TaxID=94643 RepID=A0A2A9MMA1_BESBE|nr:hypothetical protein BESB_048340 [Besnoitia besnoiti]PFH36642.1 hypothetical protein BESB_048340 [Besnoitia besnoiti]